MFPSKFKFALRFWWPSLLFPLFTVFLFGPTLYRQSVLGFRDSLHFYFPLWFYIESLNGWQRLVPMWNPWDGLGCSIVAEPTSMVFYPPRWLMLIPLGTFEQRMGTFFIGHLWFAYFLWLGIGRSMRWSLWQTQLSGWAYALSGPIFFQIYNPPFLVGAAWIPLAMMCVLRLVAADYSNSQKTSFRRVYFQRDVVLLSLALAMMVLGGDAQSAYHTLLIGAVLLGTVAVLRKKPWSITQPAIRLTVAGIVAIGLAAVQIFPTWHWMNLSIRSSQIEATVEESSLPIATEAAGSELNRFEFANQVWYGATWIVPDAFGSFVPTHTRWSQLFSADGRVWIPSLHIGTSLFLVWGIALFAKMSLCRRQGSTHSDFVFLVASSVAVITFLISCNLGLYTILSSVLPWYDMFRYPAKWSVWSTWGLCTAIAAWKISDGESTTWSGRAKEICELKNEANREDESNANSWLAIAERIGVAHRWLAWLGVVLLAVHLSIVVFPTVRLWFYAWMSKIPSDTWCGTIDFSATVRRWGQSGVELILIGSLVGWSARRAHRDRNSTYLQVILLVTTILQLAWHANDQANFVDANALIAKAQEGADFAKQLSQSEVGDDLVSIWKFGDFEQLVVDQPQELLAGVDCVSPAERQAAGLLGKLHLLTHGLESPCTIRNARADFTLKPKLLHELQSSSTKDRWSHALRPLHDDSQQSTILDVWHERQVQFSKVRIEGNRVSFSYQAPLCLELTLPMADADGWSVVEGHRNASKVASSDDRLCLALQAGEEHIELAYATPWLGVGSFVTLMTLAMLCASICWNVSKHLSQSAA